MSDSGPPHPTRVAASRTGRRAPVSVVAIVTMALSLLAAACTTSGPRLGSEPVGAERDSSAAEESGTEAGTAGDGAGQSGDGAGLSPVENEIFGGEIDAEFDNGDCEFDLPVRLVVRCGTVTVPMDWATGEGQVDLAVAVFSSTADNPAPDPVVYLEGGPGGHALETVEFVIDDFVEPLLERGDVVFFDQRGAGLSEPRLECAELTEFTRFIEDTPALPDDEVEAGFHDALARCRARLVGDGADLADFNSIANAHDVEAIRVALGYDAWNLVGVSYGTKLGLEVMRRHPDGVRSAVLDSVYPPQVDSVRENPGTFLTSYERVAEACAAEPACGRDGDLIERYRAVIERFEADPVTVEVRDSIGDETDDIQLTGEVISEIVTQSLYTPFWFTDLPELVSELERGETAAARRFLSQQRTTERYFTDGMFFAIACQEEISFADPNQVAAAVPADPFGLDDRFELGSNTGASAFGTCEAFESGTSPASSNEPVVSDLPTLLMAGRFDPVTPVEWAEQAGRTLSASQLVVAENDSHGVTGTECGMSIVQAFLDRPDETPDGGCLDEETLSFVDLPEVSLEEARYIDGFSGRAIVTVRPVEWTVGTLDGDQYRQASFLDPTQLFQLVGDDVLRQIFAEFIEEGAELELGPVAELDSLPGVGPIEAAGLNREWRYRSGRSETIAVDWFEADVGQGDDGDEVVFVILVSSIVERDSHLERVVLPVLEAVQVEPA